MIVKQYKEKFGGKDQIEFKYYDVVTCSDFELRFKTKL